MKDSGQNGIALDAVTLRWLPWLVAISFFMQMFDGTVLNTALPAIAKSMGEPTLRLQTAVISYMLTVAILLPASGWLADRFGTRLLMSSSIGLFTFGSILCAMSPSLSLLVISRVIQGVGGAMMVPVGRLVVLKVYPRDQLINVLSFVTMPGLAGSLFGPAAGGFLVEYATWHWIFLINIPIGLAGILMTKKYMPDLRGREQTEFSWFDFCLFAGSLFLITLALEGLDDFGFSVWLFTVILAVGLLLQYIYWKERANRPGALFEANLFNSMRFFIGLSAGIFTRIGTGAVPFMVPLFMQLVMGFDPLKTGLLMIPAAVASILCKPLANPMLKHFGFRRVLFANTVLQGIFISSLSLLADNSSLYVMLLNLALLGAVNSIQFTVLNTFTLFDLDAKSASGGNTLLSVVIQVSQSLSVGIAAFVLSLFLGQGGESSLPVTESAFHWTFTILGLSSVGSALIFWFAPPEKKG